MNLMLNGIDAMKETTGGGVLTIKSEAGDGQLLISVSDTGVGLPLEQADQIFGAFFTTKDNGAGMGLPIVGQSSSRTAVACGPPVLPEAAQFFSSPCPPRLRRTRNLIRCSDVAVNLRLQCSSDER
jgi:hypothetical protein